MNKNVEHIKRLQELRAGQHSDKYFDNFRDSFNDALSASIHALRNEVRSPWRKVTKRHPGKKWVKARIIAELDNGFTEEDHIPSIDNWAAWLEFVTHWQPRPEHPEKGKVK